MVLLSVPLTLNVLIVLLCTSDPQCADTVALCTSNPQCADSVAVAEERGRDDYLVVLLWLRHRGRDDCLVLLWLRERGRDDCHSVLMVLLCAAKGSAAEERRVVGQPLHQHHLHCCPTHPQPQRHLCSVPQASQGEGGKGQ